MAARKSTKPRKSTSSDPNPAPSPEPSTTQPIAGQIGPKDSPAGPKSADSDLPSAPARRGRWFALLALPLAALALFVLLLPTLAVRTPLGNALLKQAYPGWSGSIHAQAVSVNWWSPVELKDVRISDHKSQALATAQRLRSEKSLLALLLDRTALGELSLEKPVLHLALGRESSNLEEALQAFLSPEAADAPPVDWKLSLTEGTVRIHDSLNDRQGTVAIHSLTVTADRNAPWPLSVMGEGETDFADKQGQWKIDLGWLAKPGNENASPAVRFSVAAREIALELVELALRRSHPEIELTGELRANASGEWRPLTDGPALEYDGECSLARVVAMLPGIGRDRPLRVPELSLTGRMSTAGNRVQLDNVRLDSSFGGMLLNGAVQPGQVLAALETLDLQQLLPRDDLNVSGQLDVAALARLSPQLLRLRKDAHITAGEISWRAESRRNEGRREWEALVQTSRLTAVAAGREIEWNRPVHVSFLAREDASGVTVDRAEGRSDFFTCSLEPIDRGIALNATLELSRMMTQLSQFLDLPPQSLAGTVQAQLAHQELSPGESRLTGRLVGADVRWQHATGAAWREPQIEMNLLALAQRDGQTVRRINDLHVLLTAGDDRFRIKLREPIDYRGAATDWPVNLEVSGQLESWQSRLTPWNPIADLNAAGRFQVVGQLDVSPARVAWSELVADAQPLQWRMPGVNISDPRVQIKLSGEWNRDTQQIDLSQLSWASMYAFLKGERLQVRWLETSLPAAGRAPESGDAPASLAAVPEITGRISLRGSFARLLEWGELAQPNASAVDGVLDGVLNLAQSGSIISADGKIEVAQLTLGANGANSPSAAGSRDRLTVEGKVRLDRQQDVVVIDDCRATADGLTVNAQGQIAELSGRKVADLAGTLQYDLSRLAARLRPIIGGDLQAGGSGRREFALRGPLFDLPTTSPDSSVAGTAPKVARPVWSKSLTGQAAIHWDSLRLYGVSVGPEEITAKLARQRIDLGALSLSLAAGTVSAHPIIALDRTPETLLLPAGAALRDVELTPEMCAAWIKYMAPAMANAAEIEGSFSVLLNESSLPLADPQAGNVAGTLAIKSAQLRNGPLATRFLQLAGQVQALLKRKPNAGALADPARDWVRLEKQDVAFHMADRRVHHSGLTMIVDDIPIRTSGWVGFDETLSLVAEIPLQDKWIGSDPLLQGLKGQTLRVPVSGSLKSPQIDSRIFNNLAEQLARSAGQQLLRDAVGKNLENVLGKPLEQTPAQTLPQDKLNGQVNELLQDPLKSLFGTGRKNK